MPAQATRNSPSGSGVSDPNEVSGPDQAAAGTPVPQPGALRGQAWLILQTRHAQRLIKGRPGTGGKAPIIGLLGFANRLRVIWQGARADDPYADWWLVRVDQALAAAGQSMDTARAQLSSGVEESAGLRITPAESVQPTRVALHFTNPYAYRGAQLLATYDGLARAVLTARHVGLLNRGEAERLLHQGARPVRRGFASAMGYQSMGLTRTDVAQGTATAERARAAMGEIPPEVLNGTRRALLAPAPARFEVDGLPTMSQPPRSTDGSVSG